MKVQMVVEVVIIEDILRVLCQHYPWSYEQVEDLYNECLSIDETLASLEVCRQLNTYLKLVTFNDLMGLAETKGE